MILINLLPHRAAARRRRSAALRVALAASALVGLLLAGGVYLWQAHQITRQEARNAVLQAALGRLDTQIRDIANLQSDIAALRIRQQAVENLQADRNLPVHLLNDLVRLLPEGVHLQSLRQDQHLVTLTGLALAQERVSEFLRNLAQGSASLRDPELVEIVAGTVNPAQRDARRLSQFTVRVSIQRENPATTVAPPAGAVRASRS
jgi:type IV pilus assembly protein PilN